MPPENSEGTGPETTSGSVLVRELIATRMRTALSLHAVPSTTMRSPCYDGKAALCALWCSALLLSGGPAAQASVLDDSIAAAADASFPIITAVRPDAVDRLTKLVAQASPVEFGKAVELGIDVVLSVPSDQAGAAATGLSAAFSGISPATCQLLPLPPPASFDRVMVGVDPAKLQAARLTLSKLPGREGGVCVPPREPMSKARPMRPASINAAQSADWPRLAEALGNLRSGLALREASGEPACRRLSQLVFFSTKARAAGTFGAEPARRAQSRRPGQGRGLPRPGATRAEDRPGRGVPRRSALTLT